VTYKPWKHDSFQVIKFECWYSKCIFTVLNVAFKQNLRTLNKHGYFPPPTECLYWKWFRAMFCGNGINSYVMLGMKCNCVNKWLYTSLAPKQNIRDYVVELMIICAEWGLKTLLKPSDEIRLFALNKQPICTNISLQPRIFVYSRSTCSLFLLNKKPNHDSLQVMIFFQDIQRKPIYAEICLETWFASIMLFVFLPTTFSLNVMNMDSKHDFLQLVVIYRLTYSLCATNKVSNYDSFQVM
jgi:hypothetical protein